LIYTPDFAGGTFTFIRIAVMGLICMIIVESIDKMWKLKFIIYGMILIPVGISILSIYQILTGGTFYAPRVTKVATTLGLAVFRATGTFANPNGLGCFLMIGIVIGFGILFVKKLNPLLKLLLVISIIVSSAGILTTFSRAGWLSTIAGLIIIVALHKKWSYFWYITGAVVLITIMLSVYIPQLWEVIFDRFGSIFNPSEESSSSSRISLIRTGIWMWQDHPFFGVGLRGFPKMYYDYVDPNMPHILIEVNEPHTIQAQILAEEGLIGFVVATWLFITIVFQGLRYSFTLKDDFLRCTQIACTALFVGFVVNFTFAADLTNNAFWMTVGLIYAIPFIEKYTSLKSNNVNY
ncbi:O-antigen ligase family protein, partial [Candidatus Latescibacterota bacterium]